MRKKRNDYFDWLAIYTGSMISQEPKKNSSDSNLIFTKILFCFLVILSVSNLILILPSSRLCIQISSYIIHKIHAPNFYVCRKANKNLTFYDTGDHDFSAHLTN